MHLLDFKHVIILKLYLSQTLLSRTHSSIRLIKKGGEQVSPFEVEEPLLDHPWIQTPVCFAVPSAMYGEEVGCALVLDPLCPVSKGDPDAVSKVSKELRMWLKEAKTAPVSLFLVWSATYWARLLLTLCLTFHVGPCFD